MKCGVRSVECTVLECREWGVKCKVRSVNCTVWSAQCGVKSVKRGV